MNEKSTKEKLQDKTKGRRYPVATFLLLTDKDRYLLFLLLFVTKILLPALSMSFSLSCRVKGLCGLLGTPGVTAGAVDT